MKTWPPMFVVRISDALSPPGFIRGAKERLVMALVMLVTFQLYGQGTVSFSNNSLSPVYNSQTCANAVAGTTFSVALYFAPYDPANPVPPDPSTLAQVSASAFLVLPGIYFSSTPVTVLNINPPGSFGWFQVKAWETAFGTTYEQAQTNPAALIGVSNIIKVQTGDPGPPPGPAGHLTGISGITLSSTNPPACVPEPSAVVLGFFGAALLSLLRAKNYRR